MKKYFALALSLVSFSTIAADIRFQNLTKKQVEEVGKEFSANFSHTAVAAPTTDGMWGVEVGVVGSQTPTPELKKTIESSGGDGSDFKNLYNAGIMARAHFPLDLFVELALLPEREISDVSVENKSFALGWNAGSFFHLPLDLALGMNLSSSDLSFKQTISGVPSKVEVEGSTRVFWVGVSKSFWFVTPYAKVGTAKTEADVSSSASIFGYTMADKQNVSSSGAYYAVGANLQFAFLRFGLEYDQMVDVSRVSGKLSVAF